ncbi:hypothetical protein JX265_005481 [Neoarthrinium moseri]|uniref:Xylanolytic transcriptional activator regulatory domain-containing protein n=1 Tax=Neoarthrinium moseri TaxID=1658444 RepID=A0A9Q0AQ64_9PEZI|nr:hypothetical protein JX265_005481 [Neoarthrinium moseri]
MLRRKAEVCELRTNEGLATPTSSASRDSLKIRYSLNASIESLNRPSQQSEVSDQGRAASALGGGKSGSWQTANANFTVSITPTSPEATHYVYVSGAYKMLSWPYVRQILESSALESSSINLTLLQKDGASILSGLQLQSIPIALGPQTSQSQKSKPPPGSSLSALPDGTHMTSLDLQWETMQSLSKAYFDSFNLLYPIVDRHFFQTQVLPPLATRGLGNDINSTLICLILALGEVAIASVQGDPLMIHKGRPGGIKGVSLETHPGVLFFNEARKRMGFNLTECSLENVQIFALAALYYGTCCLHTEFWRMTTSASLACQALLTSNPGELVSIRADLIRRLFWHCLITETCLNLEFNMPLTGLHHLEEIVGLPDFSAGAFSEEDYISNQASHFQEHFASQIVLRRLSVEFHKALTNDQWRGLLPPYLNWADSHYDGFSSGSQGIYNQSVFPQQLPDGHSNINFTTDFNNAMVDYPYAADIQAAILRTRYYHVKHLIYRPFIYKATHHPEMVTHEDAEGVAVCLKSSLLWPITMSPTRNKKRLVPFLALWSQNFLGILLILHLSRHVPILIRIRAELLDSEFEFNARETVRLYIDWIRDLKDFDAAASWCWKVVQSIYPDEAQ